MANKARPLPTRGRRIDPQPAWVATMPSCPFCDSTSSRTPESSDALVRSIANGPAGGTPQHGLAPPWHPAHMGAMSSPGKPRAAPGWGGARILALGHSTRPFAELVKLLSSNGGGILADIRTVPRSRHNPQYDQETLRRALEREGIQYRHLPRLGGLRRARADSPNGAWRNASFRGFADYMLTDDFEEGLRELRELARQGTVAVMCAEAVPWRCHRSLLADALLARGVVVGHVTGPGRVRPHRLTPFARVEGRRVTYPPGPAPRSRGRARTAARGPRTRDSPAP